MGDSSSFSSLFALVDNHLSRSNIQNDPSQPSTSGLGRFKMPSLNVQRGQSDTGLPLPKFPIPSTSRSHPINDVLALGIGNMFTSDEPRAEQPQRPQASTSMSDCPINDVLAIQLSNMFKAREAKEEEERRKQEELRIVADKLQRQEEASRCVIDLMPAVQVPGQVQPKDVEIISSGSSMESLVMPDVEEEDAVEEESKGFQPDIDISVRPQSPKPINRDMSYILKHKIGKCSQFGKVLCARYRPVAAPYLRVHMPSSHIKVFDFSSPSPDDMVLERLRRPTFYNNSHNSLSVYD